MPFGDTMYEAFYGLTEKPFNLTPDPRFLYLSDKHKEAFAHLLFGIRNRAGFVMVTGEIGTGKTTICRTLLSQLDSDTEVAFIFNPALSPEELLRKINEDFGIRSEAFTIKGLIDELNGYLLDRTARGKNCVLVIDEAQNLSPQVLEQIRLLSNLETETQKLLQIVLIGQPELAQSLALPELRQLNQRISARYHLRPLNRSETVQYIAYRLRVAGGRRRIRLSRGAIRAIYRFSRGTPRLVNAICDRALLIGYTKEVRDITGSIVRRAAREIRGEHFKPRKPSLLRRYIPSPAFVGAAALIILAGALLIQAVGEYAANMGLQSSPAVVLHRPIKPSISEVVEAAATPLKAHPPSVLPVQPIEELPLTFADLIDALDPVAARKAAVLGVFGRWNLAPLAYPEGDSVEGLVALAEANGFVCEVLHPTLDQLAAINLPAFVKMAAINRVCWLALVEVDGDHVRTTAGIGETCRVPRGEFEARYLKDAVVFWKDPTPKSPDLATLKKGQAVRNLQEALRAMGRYSDEPDGVYDAAVASAVKRIQRETGLLVDGIVGRQTRMVLTSWSPDEVTPSLSAPVTQASEDVVEGEAVADVLPEVEEPSLMDEVAQEVLGLEPQTDSDRPPSSDAASAVAERERPAVIAAGWDEVVEAVPAPVDVDSSWSQAPLPMLTVTELGDPEVKPLPDSKGPEYRKEVTEPATGGAPLVPRPSSNGGGDEGRSPL